MPWLALIAVAACTACLVLAHVNLTAMPFEPDTASYLFQARLFAEGLLFAEAPADIGFSASPHVNVHDGKWYSRYPLLASALLVPGVWAGYPHVVPAILTAATMIFVFLFVRELFGSTRVAMVATLFALLSPATLGVGSTLFSQSGSRLFLVIFLWALLRAIRSRRWGFALVAGTALGLAFNVRPLPAVTFAAAGALLSLVALIGSEHRRSLVGLLPGFILPLVLLIGVTLAWNDRLAGHPLQMTFNVMQPNDRLGFGMRGEGYTGNVEGLRDFRPAWALDRLLQHTIPNTLYNALGWGRYSPTLAAQLSPYADWAGAGLMVKSVSSGDWIDLRVEGRGDGTAFVRLGGRGPVDGLPVSRSFDFRAGPGRADVVLRLRRSGDSIEAEFALPGGGGFESVGTIDRSLDPPLRAGLFAIHGGTGRSSASFGPTRGPNGDDPADSLDGWSRTGSMNAFDVDAGRVRISPAANSHVSDVDTSAGLYRELEGDDVLLQSSISLDWRTSWPERLVAWAWVVPIVMTALLALLPLASARYRRAALFCLTVMATHHVGQFFYWADHSTWGYTPVAVLYYAEMVTIALVPLIACGATLAYSAVSRRFRAGSIVMLALFCALFVNTLYAYSRFIPVYREWHPVYQHLPSVVDEAKLDYAVVFVPGGRNAPVGDYPFVELDHAPVIYYRLGPWHAFGLRGEDWRVVYERYFAGRAAYLVEWHTERSGDRDVFRPTLRRLSP